jgi:hypothetical protein
MAALKRSLALETGEPRRSQGTNRPPDRQQRNLLLPASSKGARRDKCGRAWSQSAMANTGYSGLRAAVAAALTVHVGQQRPAKSLYFHTRDLALRSR